MAQPRPDPERGRRTVGAIIYGLFMLGGLVALVFFFLVMPLASDDPGGEYLSMGIGAACAIPPLVIYLWIPRLIDRYDPSRGGPWLWSSAGAPSRRAASPAPSTRASRSRPAPSAA